MFYSGLNFLCLRQGKNHSQFNVRNLAMFFQKTQNVRLRHEKILVHWIFKLCATDVRKKQNYVGT